MASDNLLLPLPRREGPRSIVQQCYDLWIPYRLAWDNLLGGHITQASTANRNHPLLRVPPELRTAILDYVLEPQFEPDDSFSIKDLDKMANRQEYHRYLAERTVDLFPPRKGVYPYSSIKLISWNLFEETQAMCAAAVEHYYVNTPLRLKHWEHWQGVISATASHKIASIQEADLRKVKSLIVDTDRSCYRPEMLFTNGAWLATLRTPSRQRNGRQWIFFVELANVSAILSVIRKLKIQEYEEVPIDRVRAKYKCGFEAFMFPGDTDREVLGAVASAAGSRELTKRVLMAVLYFQISAWHQFLP